MTASKLYSEGAHFTSAEWPGSHCTHTKCTFWVSMYMPCAFNALWDSKVVVTTLYFSHKWLQGILKAS